MRRKGCSFVLVMIICSLLATNVFALTDGVLESFTGEESISIYLNGVDAESDVTIEIGTSDKNDVTVERIGDMNVPMRTVVLIDNSLSIPAKDRSLISEILLNLISDKSDKEEIAIASFSTDIQYICDYSSDYATLKGAVESIEYINQDTYLTDVLFNLLTNTMSSRDDVYTRILVISDGVDDNTLRGITKEELYSAISDVAVPIYCIGCLDSKKTNDQRLKDMKGLSHTSMGEFILLDDYDNMMDINSILRQDVSVVKYTINPDPSQMDGLKKSIKIMTGNSTYTTECKMPQKVMEQVETVKEEPTPKVEEKTEVVEYPEPEVEENNIVLILIIILGVIIVSAAVVVFVLIKKKKANDNRFETVDENFYETLKSSSNASSEKTEILGMTQNVDGDDKTCMIWEDSKSYYIILTDINSPAKSVQVPISNKITIGRKVGNDVVYEYEKSVSGKHCEIRVDNGRFYIKDLQSSNHTYVDGSEVLSEVEIVTNNIIKLGRLELKFEVR